MMRAFQNAILVLASSIVALTMVEMSLWAYESLLEDAVPADSLNRFDPILGWTNRPGAQTKHEKSEFSYPVAINQRGMRDKELAPRRSGTVRLAALGDSFVWGWGVADQERFTQILEAAYPEIETLNYGVSGYGPTQYLLQLQDVLSHDADFVLVGFSLGSDLVDTAVSLDGCRPVATLTVDGPLELPPLPVPSRCARDYDPPSSDFRMRIIELIKEALLKLSGDDGQDRAEELTAILHRREDKLTGDQRREIEALFECAESILDTIRNRVEATLGPKSFAVLIVPSIYEYQEYLTEEDDAIRAHDRFVVSLKRLHIPFIDGRDAITAADFWEHDGHWRPSGHAKIARLIATSIRSRYIEFGHLPWNATTK